MAVKILTKEDINNLVPEEFSSDYQLFDPTSADFNVYPTYGEVNDIIKNNTNYGFYWPNGYKQKYQNYLISTGSLNWGYPIKIIYRYYAEMDNTWPSSTGARYISIKYDGLVTDSQNSSTGKINFYTYKDISSQQIAKKNNNEYSLVDHDINIQLYYYVPDTDTQVQWFFLNNDMEFYLCYPNGTEERIQSSQNSKTIFYKSSGAILYSGAAVKIPVGSGYYKGYIDDNFCGVKGISTWQEPDDTPELSYTENKFYLYIGKGLYFSVFTHLK